MLKPRQNKVIYTFFSWYISRIIRTDFRSFEIYKSEFDPGRSILLLANHFSWWDGFLMFQLNRIYFKKKFHVMITEDNYRKVKFLKYLGSFSVLKNSRSIVESLEFAGELLNDPSNLVLIFPQGKLFSNHAQQINFEKGLMKMIHSSHKKFQYLFAATFVDYFENRKPSVYCYLQQWEGAEFTSLQLIKSNFNKHYETSRQQQAEITA
ncbi:1-acyl-sn-glycerol-3-phosphate acyltransferase [Daejeonella oryzae]|uniref:1-acyl-sn-glycerol-3-phosphate acyltransferase n=1 Tax=Daejeonella oryzae TaxID=1122943 RepID=UPI000421BAB5|nr:1-acyl-sn-glycerol-3-phosphate acyltransferase [Daejeonella oryzae]